MRRLDRLGHLGHQSRRLTRRQRRACQPPGQAAALDELHREVGPAVHVAGFVDLHDVGVTQAGDRLRLAQEPLEFLRLGVSAGQQHFHGDWSLEAHVPGLVDDAHAAAAQHFLHFITGDSRQVGRRLRRWRGTGRLGKELADLGLEGTQPLPTGPDLRQQLRARAAGFFGGGTGIEEFLKQFLHTRTVGHSGSPILYFGRKSSS
jgi:hypothetical protein